MSDNQINTIERFFEMISQPAQTAAINTALRLGIIDALQEGQKTVPELARQCEINEVGTQALLQVLISSGLVEQFDEHFALSQASRLTSKKLWAIMFDQWTGLESALMNNPPESDDPEYERQRQEQKRLEQFMVVHSQIQWAATGVALKATEALGIGTERRGLSILDLGCGSAIFSMAIAHRDPGTNVQLVDDAIGLARARATIESLDVAQRVEMSESSELVFAGHNSSFDMVLAADKIHIWDEPLRQRILTTAFRTLKPGGEIAIIDVFPGQERGKMNCNLFELQLLTGTRQNTVPLKHLKDLLDKAGFTNIQYTDLPVAPYTHGLVLAAKPADAED